MKKTIISTVVLALLALPAFAQQSLQLDIKDGLVNIDAVSVPARQILAEWAKIGGTKVVGADKIAGAALTLKLVNVPERQALDIILRTVAGYMAVPRLASATPGLSAYDRILILPTPAGTPPAANNARATPNVPFTPPNRGGLPRPPGADGDPDSQVVQEVEPEPQPNQPVFTFPQPQPGNNVFMPMQPGQAGFGQPGFGQPFGAPAAPGQVPQIQLQPNPNGQPTIYNFVPNNGAAPPAGGNGFTVIGSPTPGVVQQPPPQPGQQVRPPGGERR
jgi:hypothetical protein